MSLPKLLQKLQKPSNLQRAWKELNRSNRASRGLSAETIESFGKNLPDNLRRIRRELRQKTYSFSPFRGHVLTKQKPSGKIKKRGIRIAEIQDRVVQRAICRVIEPELNKKFNLYNEASFAYLKKIRKKDYDERRSIREAINRMVNLYQEDRPFVLEADIEKYFDTVNQGKLLEGQVFPSLPEPSLNHLIQSALSQELGNRDDLEPSDWDLFPEPREGIPQGGGLSPLFANVYLNDFDNRMLAAGYGLVRYADDFIVMAKTREEAFEAYEFAKQILEGELDLKLHPLSSKKESKTRILRVTQDPFQFLGVRFNGKRLWPGSETVNQLRARIREHTQFNPDLTLLTVLQKLKYLLEGWIAAYAYTDVEDILCEIEHYLRQRVGTCAFRMGWQVRNTPISSRQKRFSGLPNLLDFLKLQRLRFVENELGTKQSKKKEKNKKGQKVKSLPKPTAVSV